MNGTHLANCVGIFGEVCICTFLLRKMLGRKPARNSGETTPRRGTAFLPHTAYLMLYLSVMFLQEFGAIRIFSDSFYLYVLLHIVFLIGFAELFCGGGAHFRILLPLDLASFLVLSRSPAVFLVQITQAAASSDALSGLLTQLIFLAVLGAIAYFLLHLRLDTSLAYPSSYYAMLLFAPIVSLGSNALQRIFQPSALSPYAALSGILSLLIDLLIFYMIAESSAEYALRVKTQLIAQRQDYQNAHMAELRDIVAEYHKIRHDMKNHITLMDRLLSRGKYDELKDYFYTLSRTVYELDNQIETGNDTVNEILNIKYAAAAQLRIPMRFDAAIPHKLAIPDYTLCALLANLLDNAIEASGQCSDPLILVKLKMVKGYLAVTVENHIDPGQREAAKRRETTKADRKLHGLGLQIVEKIVSDYNGISAYETEEGLFRASVMLELADAAVS